MAVQVSVEGLDDLLRSLEALPLALQKNIIARALRQGGKVVAEEIELRSPDDPETEGSRIAESVKVMVSEQTATGAVARIGPTSHGFPAIFIEKGSAHQTAQPFIVPAFEDTQEEAFGTIAERVLGEIELEYGKKR